MALNRENKDLAQKVTDFLTANRKTVLAVLGGIIIIGSGLIIGFSVSGKLREKSLTEVEKVIYDLEEFKLQNKTGSEKRESAGDSVGEETAAGKTDAASGEIGNTVSEKIKAEEDKAVEKLSALAARNSSYSAFRANIAIAEIYFQRKSYEDALNYYERAAQSLENFYTAGVAYFNAAACADELGNNEKALECYEKASKIKNFPLVPRALFNSGRIYEAMAKNDEAVAVYNKLLEAYPKNEWALLAKSRIIDISKNK